MKCVWLVGPGVASSGGEGILPRPTLAARPTRPRPLPSHVAPIPVPHGRGTPPMPHHSLRPVRLCLEAVAERLAPAGSPATAPTALDGRVWEDLNADGTQDPGEPGLANVTVELRAASGSVSPPVTTKTDAQGAYHFDGVTSPGSIRVIPPGGFAGTAAKVDGADESADSDF